VRRLALTRASFSETRWLEEMLRGDEAAVFADGAYAKDTRKAGLRRRGVFCGIINRAWRYRVVTSRQKRRNRFFSRVRGAVERVIGTLKRHYGMARGRYLGQVRNRSHFWLKGICYNLKEDAGAARGQLRRRWAETHQKGTAWVDTNRFLLPDSS